MRPSISPTRGRILDLKMRVGFQDFGSRSLRRRGGIFLGKMPLMGSSRARMPTPHKAQRASRWAWKQSFRQFGGPARRKGSSRWHSTADHRCDRVLSGAQTSVPSAATA